MSHTKLNRQQKQLLFFIIYYFHPEEEINYLTITNEKIDTLTGNRLH